MGLDAGSRMSARRDRRAPRAVATAAVSDEHDPGATAAASLLAIALAGTALLVDPGAAAAFDAPKRLVAIVALAGAAACLLPRARIRMALPASPLRVPAVALGAAIGWTVVAAVASPRPAIALDALRTIALFGLALPLGASRALSGARGRRLLAVFVAVVAIDAVTSLLQAAGLELFTVTAFTGRADTGAFLGNEGVLAQVTALALVVTGVVALLASRRVAGDAGTATGAAVAASGLFVAALVVNRNLTALATAGAGVTVAALLAWGRRALAPIAIGTLVVLLGVAAYAPMRGRVREAVRAIGAGDWDALTTYRLGPWMAAAEMVRDRPLVGFGPGTFGAEFVPHRLRAEMRHRERYVIPLLTSSFGEAHSEYLQAAAEGGVPLALTVVVVLASGLAALVRVVNVASGDASAEAIVLVGVLGAAAVASLTWFPFQRPVTAVPLLLMAGRAGRLLRDHAEPAHVVAARRTGAVIALVGAVLLIAACVPELARYAGERRLAAVLGPLEEIAGHGRVVPDAAPMLGEFAATARASIRDPGDTRGIVAAGTAMLVAGKPAAARANYRAALARGERAEIDLNLARAYALDSRRDEAEAALLRAVWVSPALIATLPSAERPRLESALADLSARLRRGELAAPPPLPVETSDARSD
jgi:O-antigen ligase